MEEKYKQFYQMGWEKTWAKSLDIKYRPTNRIYKNRTLDTLNFVKSKADTNSKFVLLDAGCGIGIYTINIMNNFPNSNAICFDISKEQIDFIKFHLDKLHMNKRVTLFEADIEKINLKGSKYDFILCTEVLEHLLDPYKALKNLYQIGNESTTFIFSVPLSYGTGKSGWYYRQFLENEIWIETQNISEINEQEKYYAFYHKIYSKNEIISLLESHEFQILAIKYSNFDLFKNKYISMIYSMIANYKLDKTFNFITFNKYASNITLKCKRIN